MSRSRHRVPRELRLGLMLGILMGGLLLLVAASDRPALVEEGLTHWELAVVYLGGGAVSGLIGGLLWPYQRSRCETLLFSIPTALPGYILAGWALDFSWVASAGIGVVVGVLYAVFHGGQHRT